MFNTTFLKLHDDRHFFPFLAGLREFLRTKMRVTQIDGREVYSCHAAYHYSSISWEPFKNLEAYCIDHGFDYLEVLELIKEKTGRKPICECELVNDVEAGKRDRLRRSFGIDI